MKDDSFTYVAVAPCGCIRGATVDDPTDARENAKVIADWIRRSYHIERVPSADVRTRPWKCAEHLTKPFPRGKSPSVPADRPLEGLS